MRRKSRHRYLGIALAGYVLLAVGVIGYGWRTRPDGDPLGGVGVSSSGYILQVNVRDGYESLAETGMTGGEVVPGAASAPPMPAPAMVVAEEEPVAMPAADDAESVEMVAETNREDLQLDDLRLPGSEPRVETQFEVVHENPYLVTD